MKDFCLIVGLSFFVNLCTGQDEATSVAPSVVPPAPDAAALGKYGDNPVSLYTGTPEITVPIYEIKSNKLSLPISISYHASGNKVEDIASNVGLGWTLNAGGVITRTVYGLPDDVNNGFLHSSNTVPADMNLPPATAPTSTLRWVAINAMDAQPDIFYFNFGKYSGKFIFDKAGNCYSFPHQKFRIKPAIGPLATDNSWEITTEDGITYTFAARETSRVQSVCAVNGNIPASSYLNQTYVSSWYLTKIQAPHVDEKITFSYFSQVYEYDVRGSISNFITQDNIQSNEPGWLHIYPNYRNFCDTHINITSGLILSSIEFRGGTINFTRKSRSDLDGAYRITEIILNNVADDLVKKFILGNDDYFDSGCGTSICKRLKLNSVIETGKDGSQLKPYLFEYDTEPLPARNSYDTDHWGYYNKRNNTEPVPEFVDYDHATPYAYLPGANKTPDLTGAKAGILTKIIYPTGGYTQFEYELNQVVSNAIRGSTTGTKMHYRIDGNFANPNQQSDIFTIQGYSTNGLVVKVVYQTTGCSTSSVPSLEKSCPSVQIVGVNGTTYSTVFQSGTIKESSFILPNGQYRLKGSGVYTGQSYFLQIDYETEPQPASNGLTNVMAGGLRVKKISESDGFSDNQKTRTFLYNDVDNVTTGRLNGFPVYTYNCIQWIQIYAGNGIDKLPQWEEVKLFVRTMGSNATLGSSRGAYVGYGKVTELKGISGEYGKTEYYYTSVWKSEKEQTSEFTDQNVSGLPFGPPQQEQEYKRGFLVKQIDYKLQGTYKKVREEINEYQSLGTPIQILGLKAFIYEWKDYKPYEEVYRTSLIRRYGNLSYVPMYTIERKFDSDGITYAETRNDFVYDVSHRQLKEAVTTFDSNPSSLWKRKIKSFYPADYTIAGAGNDNTSKGLKIMQDVKHIHNIVIEKQTWELRNGEEKLVDAEINLVKPNGFEIDKTLKLRVKNPLLDYVSSTVNSSGLFVYDNTPINNIPKFETLASFDLTDVTTGNMLQTINTSGMPQSYLWGYNNLYPIAQSINGNYNSSFYTSFELNANGNWNINPSIPLITDDAMTGNNCFNGDLETSNLVPPDNYTISFWAKGTGNVSINGINIPVSSLNWSVYTHYLALTSPQKISINANGIKIDELRAHPRNARMKTFTYLPITGMTSSSDEANIPTKYQYDALNRLSTTTNHNGVIVKRHSYNLKGYTGPPLGASLDPSFTISGGSTTAGAQVFFTATLPTSSGAQYDWDFGDGTIVLSGSRTAIHVFEGGIYQVRLTVRKGSSNNSSQKSVTITIPPAPAPTWSAPSITVNSSSVGPVTTSGSFPNPQVIKRDVNISVTANPATSGGVAPFKNYIWTYEGQSISGGNPIITTTPTTTLSFIEINWEQPPCGSPIPYTYKVTCKVVDANDVVSQAGNIDVNASIQLDPLVASPTSFNFTNSAGSNTVNITNTAGNVTVIPNASWIHITSITQCSSFTFSVDSNFISTQVDTQPRNGTITLSSANGTITIPISQLGYTYSQCGEGCYWNETQHRCECP